MEQSIYWLDALLNTMQSLWHIILSLCLRREKHLPLPRIEPSKPSTFWMGGERPHHYVTTLLITNVFFFWHRGGDETSKGKKNNCLSCPIKESEHEKQGIAIIKLISTRY
uniref:Uncharacterized protein n=1 Tax=Micrurus surinamensis TaxID=129470 RepID=A0A2D4NQ55_MICSU